MENVASCNHEVIIQVLICLIKSVSNVNAVKQLLFAMTLFQVLPLIVELLIIYVK